MQAPKGKTTKATLYREHMDYESVTLSSLAPDRIVAAISGLENQTPALKEAIAKLGELATGIGKANAHRRALDAERQKIGGDQDRIRKNLASTGASSDLGRRYLDTLKNQEDRLAAIAAEEKTIEQDVAAKMKEAEGVAQALVLLALSNMECGLNALREAPILSFSPRGEGTIESSVADVKGPLSPRGERQSEGGLPKAFNRIRYPLPGGYATSRAPPPVSPSDKAQHTRLRQTP